MPPRKKTATAATGSGTTVQEVTIRPLNLQRTVVRVRGISSLMMHAWSKKAIEMMEAKQQKKARGAREAKVPEDDFNEARYRIDERTDGVPAVAVKSCAVEAGVALGKFKTALRKAFFVCPDGEEFIPILDATTGKPSVPAMRRDMVRVGMGTADVRYRPEYKNWALDIPVEFNAELISGEELFNLFDAAGYSVGIGEYRPEKDGPHGRFRVRTSSEDEQLQAAG